MADRKMSEIGSVEKALFVFSENSLMRCGLMFSGANHLWSGKEAVEGVDDGILTGMEISRLNLLKTELAIVSACLPKATQRCHVVLVCTSP